MKRSEGLNPIPISAQEYQRRKEEARKKIAEGAIASLSFVTLLLLAKWQTSQIKDFGEFFAEVQRTFSEGAKRPLDGKYFVVNPDRSETITEEPVPVEVTFEALGVSKKIPLYPSPSLAIMVPNNYQPIDEDVLRHYVKKGARVYGAPFNRSEDIPNPSLRTIDNHTYGIWLLTLNDQKQFIDPHTGLVSKNPYYISANYFTVQPQDSLTSLK